MPPMLEPGLRATVEETVSEDMTAERLGSGDVPVLGTPALLALVEAAAVAAVSDALERERTTVGSRVELEHLAPSPVGAAVAATAELEEVDGRTLRFAFEARDGPSIIARGTHERVVVDRTRFVDGVQARAADDR